METAKQLQPQDEITIDDRFRQKIIERAKEIEKDPPQWITVDELKKELAEI